MSLDYEIIVIQRVLFPLKSRFGGLSIYLYQQMLINLYHLMIDIFILDNYFALYLLLRHVTWSKREI